MVHETINSHFIYTLFQDRRSVYRLIDLAMLTGETDREKLGKKLHYYVNKGILQNPHKGIYTKVQFSPKELACRIYAPAYISLEYVLQNSGIIFQYSEVFTLVSYLSRTLEIDDFQFKFRKIKNEILIQPQGINRLENGVNVASAERAFCDMLYLKPDFYFDNIQVLNYEYLIKIAAIYNSATLNKRVKKIIQNG
ncbi:MAG: hypothetical protein KJ754_09205 [Bacteroidetes bacterium]|nr:hypothetical protein [Bacteroidota bacterium]MBU1579592.1 hypothetical protein [Bacteroidota bacterium]